VAALWFGDIGNLLRGEDGLRLDRRLFGGRPPALVAGGMDPIATALLLDPAVLVVDLEPGVVSWGSSQAAMDLAIDRLSEAVRGHNVQVVLSTNFGRHPSQLPPGIVYRSSARKPWDASYIPAGRPLVVIGDQVFTDGLLARRLSADFFVFVAPRGTTPWWPRLQRTLGGTVMNWVLRERPNAVTSFIGPNRV
jgi:predicted HAD superfamily phosphohydrolase YqeG